METRKIIRDAVRTTITEEAMWKMLDWSGGILVGRPDGHEASRTDIGVDHGGGAQRGHVPPEFGVGDDNAYCPPQILSYKYKK